MLINSLIHVTVLLSDLNIPSALQNRLYSRFTNSRKSCHHCFRRSSQRITNISTRKLTLLGTLSFKSHSKCYSAYLATNQLMITIWGFRDPYFRITCYINQIIATVWNAFPTTLCKHMKFGISYDQNLDTDINSLAYETVQEVQPNIPSLRRM